MCRFANGWILAGYTVPYAFLAMWCDRNYGGTPGWWYGYGVLLVGALVLGWAVCRKKSLLLTLTGNSLSILSSTVCVFLFQTSHWESYFKPFLPTGFVFFLTGAVCLAQCMAVYLCKPFRYDRK